MPLIVKDPRGVLTKAPEQARTQLTSSVDVAPLLLTIATRFERMAARTPLRAPRAAGQISLRSSPTRPRRAATMCCTQPTRP